MVHPSRMIPSTHAAPLRQRAIRSMAALGASPWNRLSPLHHAAMALASTPFVRSEFDRFGSPEQVGRVLGKLKQAGVLVQLGVGDAMARSSSTSAHAGP